MGTNQLRKEIRLLANPSQAKNLQRFFKTGKGEYGEGDKFLGLRVPDQRKIVKKYRHLKLNQVEKLLSSGIHEHRLVALLILVLKFEKADQNLQRQIYQLYLKNTKYINNWDLVDLSAPKIIGPYLLDKKRDKLYQLAKSKSLWERRISVLACFAFIRDNDFKDTLKIAKLLLGDEHDLIHKAVGWMLREMGKKNKKVLEKFLQKYAGTMPRTMLRYSIEKFSKEKRKYYLNFGK